MNEKDSLINILFDSSSSDAERDDAAILLGNFDDMIKATCGESLATIWLRNSKINLDILKSLEGIASVEALSLIKHQRPDWYEESKK